MYNSRILNSSRGTMKTDYLTTMEAAIRLKCATTYIRRLCRRSVLTAEEFGRDWRIERRSVERYQAAREAGQVKRGPKKGTSE